MKIGIIVCSLVTILIVALSLMNPAQVAFSLLGAQLSAPAGALVIGGYVFGLIGSFSLLLSRLKGKAASNKRLGEWEAQDAKLAVQVQTDKEKQLEAKVATLEAALQRALKK